MSDLTSEQLRELLNYDPQTGVFMWCNPITNAVKAGQSAGHVDKSHGYRKISVAGGQYYAHRLAWFYMTGKWPRSQIDHINMDRADNRFCNLREATNAENNNNRGLSRRNTSGAKGVHFFRRVKKWKVAIRNNGQQIHLGYFSTKSEAEAAYARAAEDLHGEFRRLR